jgi:hypothetical protein
MHMKKRIVLSVLGSMLACGMIASSATASHEHPIGASPIRVPLVPAFAACTSANSTHGLPLNFPSCNPPVPKSSTVKWGAGSISNAWLIVCNVGIPALSCNETAPGFTTAMQPDVRIFGAIRDVQCRLTGTPAVCSAGADYNPNGSPGPYTTTCTTAAACGNDGRPLQMCTSACTAGIDGILTALLGAPSGTTVSPSAQCGTNTACLAFAGKFVGHSIRVTDHYNCDPSAPGGDPNACPADSTTSNRAATMVDILYPVPYDCLPTASAALGSVCGVNTTSNSLVPGSVLDGKQGVVEAGEIAVIDAGPNGIPGDSDGEIFGTQGLYLP